MKEGTIVTFYSYKGGVGRTFALASIGALLNRWGYKTLCVDWDLEAPSLHLYFKPWMSQKDHQGLINLIQAHADGKNPKWKDYVTEVHLPNADEPLLFMSAGLQDDLYIQNMQNLNWQNLYEKYNLGSFLENIREIWKETLDFVLIDSRTGITDIGGICTVQLPDFLFLLFTSSNQSLFGSVDFVERARRSRSNLPFDRAKLLVLPVAARFEGRVEYTLAEEWLTTFAEVLTPLYAEWSHRDVRASDLLNFARIPYIPYWSFGEKLPVIEKGTENSEDVGFSLETLAALVAQKLSFSDTLISNRDSFVATAKKGQKRDLVNEQTLESEHSDTATDLDNLAKLWQTQGEYAQAEPLYQQALAIREQLLGPEHPDTASSLNNLAELYQEQGKYAQAGLLYQRALASAEKAFGPVHLRVSVILTNLASLYQEQKQYVLAQTLFQRALKICEQTIGKENSFTITVMKNYAAMLANAKRKTKAAELEARIKEIQAKLVK